MTVIVRETGRTHDTAGESYPTQADAITGAVLDGGGTVVTTVTLVVTVDVTVDPQEPAGQPVPVAATANGHDGNEPGNVLDGDPDTRWSHDGSPSILTVELAELSDVAGVDIEQYYSSVPHGPGKGASFNLYLSSDGQTWTQVYEGGSDGVTAGFERYTWPSTPARWVRYEGFGRPGRPSPWNSLTQVRVLSADDADTPLPEPEPDPDPDVGTVAHGVDLQRSDVGTSGNLTRTGQTFSTRDGQVIENLEIRYPGPDRYAMVITHDNVTVRNCRIVADGPTNGIKVDDQASGTIIERCDLDGGSPTYGGNRAGGNWGNVAIHVRGTPTVVRRCFFTGWRSCCQCRIHGVTFVENWIDYIHQNAPNVSGSSISYRGSVLSDPPEMLVARNRLFGGPSSGIPIYPTIGPARNVRIVDNLMVGNGKGFGMLGGRDANAGNRNWCKNRNIRIERNRFDGTFGYPSARGGATNAAIDLERPGNTFVDNRWVSGELIPARCGKYRDACDDLAC